MATTRTSTRLALLLLLVTGALALLAGTAQAQSSSSAEEQFRSLVNEARAAEGHAPLQMESQLVDVARGWTAVMAREDSMYHNPSVAQQATGDWTLLGENVGWTLKSGAPEGELVERLHAAFMNSPGHRANIMGDYNLIGVGVSVTPENKMWVTVNFTRATPSAPVPEPVAAPAPVPAETVTFAAAEDQIDEAARVSREVIADDDAEYVVLARSDVFADALGGSGLASGRAPVLFTQGPSDADPAPRVALSTLAEIDRALPDGGTVYLLGGPKAVAPSTEAELRDAGYDVRRLAGGGRIETAQRVAEEVVRRRGEPEKILLARADAWADAISGGAYAAFTGVPVILSGSDDLAAEAAEFLAAHPDADVVALGGTTALKEEVVADAGARRIAGGDRTQTAVAIAEQLWGFDVDQSDLSIITAPGYTESGWAYALAYVVKSAAEGSPQLLVGDTAPDSVRGFIARMDRVTVTAASSVPAPVVAELSRQG
jgi:uncharacterized protein YkwD